MKFIKSYYNCSTGESEVIMQHLGIKFRGRARLHPEDKNHGSNLVGCQYAEIRATIKALKYERKIVKQNADAARDFIKACECYKNFDKESPTARVLYRQLNRRIQRVNDLTDKINNLYSEIENKKFTRNVVLRAFDKLQAKKDN